MSEAGAAAQDWRRFSPEELARQYSPRGTVSNLDALLQDYRTQSLPMYDLPHLRDVIADIGVGQDFQIMPESVAHRFHARNVIAHRITNAKLHGLVARFHMRRGFINQLRRRLIAKRNATGIGWHRPRGTAEQLVKRQVQRLALGIP